MGKASDQQSPSQEEQILQILFSWDYACGFCYPPFQAEQAYEEPGYIHD